MKLDGIQKDINSGRKNEEEFYGVRLIYNKFIDSIQIDVNVTPLYCKKCDKQLPHLYVHLGSRYGYVGSVECDYCGKEITASDSDNIVTFLATSAMYFDYYKLFMLEDHIWERMKETTDYDIYLKEPDVYFSLHEIVDEICETKAIKLDNFEDHGIVTDEKIKKLPIVVNKWFALIKHLNIV